MASLVSIREMLTWASQWLALTWTGTWLQGRCLLLTWGRRQLRQRQGSGGLGDVAGE